MTKIKTGIIGATGYTGSELVRILFHHPDVDIRVITSESRAGEKFSDVHPFFEGLVDHSLISSKEIDKHDLDLVFLALPHGVSMEFVKDNVDKPFKIIDLSGDFRLSSPNIYEEWYQKTHLFPDGFSKSVYGLPELFRAKIKDSRLIANPGCYPTGAILGAAPMLAGDFVKHSPIIIDSKSGITGAGVKAKSVTHFANVNDNFRAYGLMKHRHTIEIQENLQNFAGIDTLIQFTPHLLPVDRGILSTIYMQPAKDLNEEKIRNVFSEFYQDEPFVRIRKKLPAIKDVRGTNYCDIYSTYDDRTNMIICITAIDNLVKGAAGQAVQNMNIMYDFPEKTGIEHIALNP